MRQGIKIILVCVALFPLLLHGKLTVFSEQFSGFQYYNKHGEFSGINFEKVSRALANAGIDYELNVLPWTVSYNGALRDKNACIFSIARLPIREQQFTWVAKLSGFKAYFYALPEKPITLTSIAQAKAYKTAVVENNFSHHFLKQHGFIVGKHLLTIDNVDQLFQIMKQRSEVLDLIVLNETQYLLKRKLDSTTPKLNPIYKFDKETTSLYFACHKDMDKRLLEQISTGFRSSI